VPNICVKGHLVQHTGTHSRPTALPRRVNWKFGTGK